ncbi:hypothetical protein DCO46_08520 [Flavobacterium sp. HTF]|nr:hypothetical protein DCO46_08520 [Flavobacterium sp. HTF]
MNSKKSWITCCFFNFLIASGIGLVMRFTFLFPLQFINYTFLLHAHSHVAMLGWAYLMIYVLIVCFFIPEEKRQNPIYSRLFWLTEFTVIGMMISFSIQGYAFFSILFSTLHIFLSYVFCRKVWKDCHRDKNFSGQLLSMSILFMVLSTFGVWCLGPAVSTLGKQNAFYQIAIQFFLHFQFNGWFLLAVLALFLKQFTKKIESRMFNNFFLLLVISVFLTFAFPVSWYISSEILYGINLSGVLLQIISFWYFYKMLKPQIMYFKAGLNQLTKLVYSLSLCSLFLKLCIQLVVLIPNLGESSHHIRNFVIGFVHLTTLGIITGFLFGVLLQAKLLATESLLMKSGMKCFIWGYIATEIVLFVQGGFFYFNIGLLRGYYTIIFAASILIVLGLFLISVSLLNKKQESVI